MFTMTSKFRAPFRLVVLWGSFAGGLLVCWGCHQAKPTIAVIPRTSGTWLWEAEHTGVAREAPRHGLYVYWNAPMREDDVQGQIDLLASAVHRKMAGVIISPIEDLPLRTPLQRTLREGIPVVVVDTEVGLPPSPHLSYVLNDERLGGQLAARRIGERLHGAGSVAIFGINNKLASLAERARSLESTLADEFPKIQVVWRSLALPTVSQEQQAAEQLLAKGPQPDAIVTLSEPSTRGTFFALIEFKRNGKIPLVGFDQSLLAPIRTGEIDSVVIQNTYRMGRTAMRTLAQEIGRKAAPTTTILQPELVTRDNIDAPQVREALDLDWYRP